MFIQMRDFSAILCKDEANVKSHVRDFGKLVLTCVKREEGVNGMGDATPLRRNVAVFLDMENLVGTCSGGKSQLKLGEVVTEVGRIVRQTGPDSKTALVRAYAHWGRPSMADFQREILEHGIEPVQVFSFDNNIKNAADIELCVGVLSVAHEAPWVEVFVIVSGDGGFVPLIRRLHALNKYVIVASTNTPNSGIVNALLKSVADEYHQIAITEVSVAPQTQHVPVPKANSNVAATVELAPKTKKTQLIVQPKTAVGVAELRDSIRGIIKQHPELVIANRVNTGALGQILIKEQPQLSYKKCGSKTLGAFLKKHCGLCSIPTLAVARPAVVAKQAKSKNAVLLATKNVAPIQRPSPEFLLDAVRRQFTVGELGKDVQAKGADGLQLNLLGVQLKTAINGFTAANAGFPRLQQVLEHALATTDYRVVRHDPYRVAVVHEKHAHTLEPVFA
ncbi:NYN domain-containing protein [Paeniglutamicibacter sp. NPDC012692]|uniref:NYN domain-containing protein n=1 Tax=Paeniglutamicibacter sp. NPDC012692 TaxID=3364388 RepID=UPI0036C0534A